MLKPLMMIALTLSAVPAIASTAPAGRTVHVSTADLDLNSREGRQTLDRRLRVAVDTVCPANEAAPVTGMLRIDRCRQNALASVRRQRNDVIASIDAKAGKRATGIAIAVAK